MSDLIINTCYNFNPDSPVHTDCVPNTPPGGNAGDDCVTKWKDEKDIAGENLKRAIANVQKYSEALKYALEWEAKLKLYFDNIYKTSELSDKVARETKGFKTHVTKVCINAECLVKAIEMLFCEVRAIYEPCVRELVDIMNKVYDCLKCNTDPALDRGTGILKTLAEYGMKLREIEALQFDTLKKVVEALKCANILFYSICKGEKQEEYGCDALINELEVLIENFGNCIPCDSTTVPTPAPALCCKMPPENCAPDSSAATPYININLAPIPLFPLCKDPYYLSTEIQYSKAQADKTTAKNCLDEAKEAKESAQACYASLVDAIKKSEDAKNGK